MQIETKILAIGQDAHLHVPWRPLSGRDLLTTMDLQPQMKAFLRFVPGMAPIPDDQKDGFLLPPGRRASVLVPDNATHPVLLADQKAQGRIPFCDLCSHLLLPHAALSLLFLHLRQRVPDQRVCLRLLGPVLHPLLAQTLRFLHAFLGDLLQPENLRIIQHPQSLDDMSSPGGVAQRQLVVDPLKDFLPLCRHMPAQLGQRLLVFHHHLVPGQLRRRHRWCEDPLAEGIQQQVHQQDKQDNADEDPVLFINREEIKPQGPQHDDQQQDAAQDHAARS